MSAQNTLDFTKPFTAPATPAMNYGQTSLNQIERENRARREAPALARLEASKISEKDIANQRRARAVEANMRGVPVQGIGRGAATLFAPNAGTSATKTLLGQ